MKRRTRNAEKTRGAIIEAARRLFAERDIAAASIRDIAGAAGVSHGLVEQYYGTRERLIAAVIQSEIEDFNKRFPPVPASNAQDVLGNLRRTLRTGRARFHDYAVLITRAQLAGVQPEKMLDPAIPTPSMALAAAIRDLQADAPPDAEKLDPFLVSAYINAVLFAFETIAPWLMASVGLKAEDYQARHDEFVDISLKLISLTIGKDPKKR